MDIITHAESRITQKISPHEAAELRMNLSGAYSRLCGEMEEILTRKSKTWLAMRAKHKSDKATDTAWGGTADGLQEELIRLRMKRVDKLMSSLSTFIKVAEGEAKNLF